MSKTTLIITGNNGAIGSAITDLFKKEGYFTIGIDRDPSTNADKTLRFDIANICNNILEKDKLSNFFEETIPKDHDTVLINNAAVQINKSFFGLKTEHLVESLNVNCIAPFVLVKLLMNNGSNKLKTVVNISSIHRNLSKKDFLPYSVSKSALSGLTRALALDIGESVRVCEILPAAIDTEMLRKGLSDDEKTLEKLNSYHPSGSIGKPEDVAEIAFAICNNNSPFINGASINLDGGISYSLSDPDILN